MKNEEFFSYNKKSPPEDFSSGGLHLSFLLRDWKKAVTYSPALHCSTIGASGLNFSVRNGKRWNPAAVATWYGGHLLQTSSFEWRMKNEEWRIFLNEELRMKNEESILESFCFWFSFFPILFFSFSSFRFFHYKDVTFHRRIDSCNTTESVCQGRKALGQLVALGFDVAVFTPAPYQRRRLRRPSMEF